MDKEDSVNTLDFLLDGIGIKKEEIEQFIDWNKTIEDWRKIKYGFKIF
ncbi:hypothetical protein [Anaerobutyricum hallii]|nr:hypothetical protein [Anaerobutyricum hallii]